MVNVGLSAINYICYFNNSTFYIPQGSPIYHYNNNYLYVHQADFNPVIYMTCMSHLPFPDSATAVGNVDSSCSVTSYESIVHKEDGHAWVGLNTTM